MKRCELLSPAGNAESFIAAAEAGADAIYLGGTAFNARMNAGNFTRGELKEAFDFARIRGIKTYVTMNTLIKDDEMTDALTIIFLVLSVVISRRKLSATALYVDTLIESDSV